MMKFDRISVLLPNLDSVEIYGLVNENGLLAVHPSNNEYDGWTVTQVKTGGAIYTFDSERQAIDVMRKLETLDGWENDNIEYFANNKEMTEQVGQIIKESIA